jgi:hypothetical protein
MTTYKWNNWECTEFPSEGVKNCTLVSTVECPFPYDPTNPQKFTWCAPPGAEQEEAPYGGNFYNTLVVQAPKTNEKTNQFSKSLFLYAILSMVIIVGIAIMVLVI